MTTLGELRISGTVTRGGQPVEGAYLTLNKGQEFIAERRTGPDGSYEFHTTPGDWTVMCRASGSDPSPKDVSGDGEQTVDFSL